MKDKQSSTQNFTNNLPEGKKQFTKMKNKTISIVFDRKKTATPTKAASVEIRISQSGKSHYISTGIKCKSGEFKNGRVIKRLDMASCNERIATMCDNVRNIVSDMATLDMDKVKAKLQGLERDIPMMSEWLYKRANERIMRDSTRRQHIVAINFLLECGIFKDWSDITLPNIALFDEMLKRKCRMQTTVYGYHKRIKPYIADAKLFGYIESNPYESYKTPKGKSERLSYLTEEEKKRIEETPLNTDSLKKVRDLFLFQCYTGLAYADASILAESSFIESEGALYIVGVRQKSGSDIAIKVISKARAILEKYDYNLPWISIQKYNLYLKALAVQCGIDKRLSSHMGRHTFATSALHKGVPIEVVSKMLSHSDIQTTQIYAKVLAEDVNKGFDLLDE